jgi:hypothetical protein
MLNRWVRILNDAYEISRIEGLDELKRGAFRFSRQRLPVGLWPRLLFDPVKEADATVRLHETSSIQLEYDGEFEEGFPGQLAAVEGRILGAEGVVHVYRDADILGRRPIVGLDEGYFPPSWLGIDTDFFLYQKKALKRNLPLRTKLKNISGTQPSRTIDSAFLLMGERSHELPQWHHEVLPKLKWLEGYSKKTGDSPKLIVSADLNKVHEKTLRLMGYDDWVHPGEGPIRVRKLIVAPHPRRSKGTHLHTAPTEWVSDRIRSNMTNSSWPGSSRIYVSRQDAGRRRVQNEESVIRALEEVGFECYEPGRLTYEEQVQMFADADVIVGAHGKAFMNIIHSRSAGLLEMFPDRGVTEHYFLAARELGLSYEYFVGEPVYGTNNLRPRDNDFIVDDQLLQSRVLSLIDDVENN